MSVLYTPSRASVRGPEVLAVVTSDELVSVERSTSVQLTATVTRQSMQGGALTVTVTGLPDGVTASVGALSTTTSLVATATITLTASANAPVVTAAVFGVRGTLAGGLTATAVCRVTVPEPPPGPLFVLSVQSPVNLVRDATVAVAITALRNANFTASIDLSIDEALPSGVTASFAPDPMTGTTSTLTLSATNAATLGTVTVTVRGEAVGSDDDTASLTCTVVAAGSFAHLAPLVELPRNAAETAITYDSTTGATTGDVYAPALETPAWLAANTLVRTVKASGGDYTPAQFQTALNAAAADTTNHWTLVVDAGLALDRNFVFSGTVTDGTFVIPARPNGSTRWLHLVSSDWYSGAWTPSSTAHFDPVNDPARCFTIRHTRTLTDSGQAAPLLVVLGNNVRIVGLHWQRPATYGPHIAIAPCLYVDYTQRQFVLEHSALNGQASGGTFNTQVGIRQDGTNAHYKNVAAYGFSVQGRESAAVYSAEGRHHQFVWCWLEAASINYFTGGQALRAIGAMPHDVLFRKCYVSKRQQWNPASHLYVGSTVKNLFEPKVGYRMFIEDCEFEGSFRSGQTALGIAPSVTNQWDAGPDIDSDNRPGFEYEVSRLGFLNCRIRNVGTAFIFAGYQSVRNTKPTYDIDVVNCLAMLPNTREVDNLATTVPTTGGDGVRWATPVFGSYAQQNYSALVGNQRLRWTTIAYAKANTETGRLALLLPAPEPYITARNGTMVDNCVLPDGGIQIQQNEPNNSSGVNALRSAYIAVRKTAFCTQSNVGQVNVSAAAFAGGVAGVSDFPDQTDPNLFVSTRAALWADPATGDFGLAASCPAKGKADGARDPGVDMAQLNTRLANVRQNPLNLNIEWVNPP
jgi:hypothetical protein